MLRKELKFILPIVGLAVGLRIAWALAVHTVAMSDFEFYFHRGIDLAAGLGYQIGGHPTAYWPPGYPLFLAGAFKIFGPSLSTAKMVNIALWACIVFTVYVVGHKLGGRAVAVIAGVIMAIVPEYILLPALIASENLMILLVLILVAIAGYSRPIVEWSLAKTTAVGALLGFSALVRPAFLLLAAAIPFIVLLRFRSLDALRAATLMCVGAALIISPWLVRNILVIGAPVFSTNGGISLWWGNNPIATGGYKLKGPYPDIGAWTVSTKAEVDEDKAYRSKALEYIASNPQKLITMAPAKLDALFNVQPMVYWSSVEYKYSGGRRWKVFRKLNGTEADLVGAARFYKENYNVAVQNTYWILGMIGLIWAFVRRAPGSAWIALIVVYWLAFHITLGNGQPRYLLVVTPLVIICASYLVVATMHYVRRLAHRGRPAPATVG